MRAPAQHRVMALQLGPHLMGLTDQFRFEPVTRRIRAFRDSAPVLDTTGAALVWEPRRVVPMYAVPEADIVAALVPCPTPEAPADLPPILGPVNFGWHLQDGESFTVQVADVSIEAAAFRPADPDLEGRVILEWAPFDWVEEAQPVMGHPHDPFKRLDVLPSDRHVVVSLGGQTLADTRRAVAVYESHIPVRWYVPRDDVRLDLLTASDSRSVCAYKGAASYFSVTDEGEEDGTDVAWTYADPLHEASRITDHLCFYSERTDLTVDGVEVPRPRTPWSSPRAQETM
jgi:uncharacterized protein (DUF427 family)